MLKRQGQVFESNLHGASFLFGGTRARKCVVMFSSEFRLCRKTVTEGSNRMNSHLQPHVAVNNGYHRDLTHAYSVACA